MNLVEPAGRQAESFVGSVGRLNLWTGSVSSGKTIISLLRWLHFAATGPEGDLLMAGKSERTLKRNCLDLLEEWLGDEFIVCRGAGEARLWDRRIYLMGMNDERAHEKVKGMTLAGAYGDELTTWPESAFSMLVTRLRVPGAKLFATTNPDSPMHWLKVNYLDRADAPDVQLRAFVLNLPDNPNLDAEYVAAMRAQFRGLWARRFIDGLWVAAEGAVYDMLDLDLHVVAAPLTQMSRWTLSLDYATSSVTHAVLMAVGGDDRLHVVREWVWDAVAKRQQITDGQTTQKLAQWLDTGADGAQIVDGEPLPILLEGLVVDPSAASLRRQFQVDGWGWATPADNAVVDGIRSVGHLLSSDRLHIDPSCTALLRELQGYTWDAKAQARGEDRPMKVNDHGADALRYGVAKFAQTWRRWLPVDLFGESEAA